MTALALRGSDVPDLLADQMTLARALAASGLLPAHLSGRPENLLVIQFAARALGVPLWSAISGMHVINGRVGLTADLQRALVVRAGHTFRVVSSTTESAMVLGIRADDPSRYEHRASFTAEEARAAKLSGGSWTAYPAAMLVARATTRLAAYAFPDVIAGLGADSAQIFSDDHAPSTNEQAASWDQQPYVDNEQIHDPQEWPELVAPALASARHLLEQPRANDGVPGEQIAADSPRTLQPFNVEAWQAKLDVATTEVELSACGAQIATARSNGLLDEDLYAVLVESGKLRRRELSESPVTW